MAFWLLILALWLISLFFPPFTMCGLQDISQKFSLSKPQCLIEAGGHPPCKSNWKYLQPLVCWGASEVSGGLYVLLITSP